MPQQQTVLSAAAAALVLATTASAHMEMSYPPALRGKYNPHSTTIDYGMTSPLSADGSNYPCKGYLSDLGTAAGAPVASWTAGETHNFTIVGGANHNGGSCQAALSVDGGKTFHVIHSYVGGCPVPGKSYDFKVPAGTPDTEQAVFAWTWQNLVGNREFYMNCGVVSIKGGGSGGNEFSSRPGLFLANLGSKSGGCQTKEGVTPAYPDPGPDVDINDSNAVVPCGGGGNGGDGGSGSGGSPNAPPNTPSNPPSPANAPANPPPSNPSPTYDDGQYRWKPPASQGPVNPTGFETGTADTGVGATGTGTGTATWTSTGNGPAGTSTGAGDTGMYTTTTPASNNGNPFAPSNSGDVRTIVYTRGNDWPDWFTAAGSQVRPFSYWPVLLAGAIMVPLAVAGLVA